MSIEECFKIGYISKTHGLKGEVTAVFQNEFELEELSLLFLEFNGSLVPYFVEKITGKSDKPFLKFESIDIQAQASALKGRSIFLPKSIRPKLKRGQFYDDEVIGYTVEDETIGELGSISEVQSSGPNRLLVIIHNQREILVPIDSPFIKSVNKTQKTIKLKLPEGYLEV
ncbi:MAG: 16S rRNA processing protein RimM [Bacteroidetes bacterium]|nr:16S rRNA processing protein RimM [Bacteroidota bacterium]